MFENENMPEIVEIVKGLKDEFANMTRQIKNRRYNNSLVTMIFSHYCKKIGWEKEKSFVICFFECFFNYYSGNFNNSQIKVLSGLYDDQLIEFLDVFDEISEEITIEMVRDYFYNNIDEIEKELEE